MKLNYGAGNAPPTKESGSDLGERLADARRRLKGWTVTGDGLPLDRLLDEAIAELEDHRKQRACVHLPPDKDYFEPSCPCCGLTPEQVAERPE